MLMVTFNLFHFSSIQQGIQGGHAANAVRNKYPRRKDVKRWATKDLTINHKNGGDSSGLEEIVKLFKSKDNPYAWEDFREPDAENIRTSVAICVPEHIYVGKGSFSGFEEKLVALIKRCPLAR